MKSNQLAKTLCGLIASAALAAVSQAEVTLSDFSNFNLTGTYVAWDSGTFTSGATAFSVLAGDFGGGFQNLPAPVNATGNDTISIRMDVNAGNIANKFNIVLVDGDGTERAYRFDNIAVGNNQTFTKNVASFLQDNAPGSTPGLNLANITAFHLQGTFTNGNPGQTMDMTFDKLSFVVAPFVPDTITNGDFETPGGVGWGTTQGIVTYPTTSGNPDGNAVLESTGGFAVLYAFNNSEKTFASLGLAPGDEYTFQVDMKVIAGNIGGIRLEGPAGYVVDTFAPTNLGGAGWATYSFPLIVPASPASSKFGLRTPDGSTVAFDNAVIVLPEPAAAPQPSILIGKTLNWTPTVVDNFYQPQESADNSVWTNLGPAYLGTTVSSLFDPTPAPFYRVQESVPVVEDVAYNGGFEIEFLGDVDGWIFFGQVPELITTGAHTGTNSIKILVTGSAGMGAVSGLEQNTTNATTDASPIGGPLVGPVVTGGNTYDLSFWAKNNTFGPGYVQRYIINWLDGIGAIVPGGGTNLPFPDTGGAWVQVVKTGLVAPAGAVTAQILIQGEAGGFVESTGEVLIDDVALVTTAPGTPTTIASSSESTAEISWQSVAGQSYQLRSSTDLSGWAPFGGTINGNGSIRRAYDTPIVTKKFYQLGTQ